MSQETKQALLREEDLDKLMIYLGDIPYKYARPIVDFIDEISNRSIVDEFPDNPNNIFGQKIEQQQNY